MQRSNKIPFTWCSRRRWRTLQSSVHHWFESFRAISRGILRSCGAHYRRLQHNSVGKCRICKSFFGKNQQQNAGAHACAKHSSRVFFGEGRNQVSFELTLIVSLASPFAVDRPTHRPAGYPHAACKCDVPTSFASSSMQCNSVGISEEIYSHWIWQSDPLSYWKAHHSTTNAGGHCSTSNQHRRSLLHNPQRSDSSDSWNAVSIHVCVCFFCLKEQADFVINNLGIQLKKDLKNSMCKWRPLLLLPPKVQLVNTTDCFFTKKFWWGDLTYYYMHHGLPLPQVPGSPKLLVGFHHHPHLQWPEVLKITQMVVGLLPSEACFLLLPCSNSVDPSITVDEAQQLSLQKFWVLIMRPKGSFCVK